MPRFFVHDVDESSGIIRITGDDVTHIKKVLRLETGEEISACNLAGTDYVAEIRNIEKNEVTAVILSKHDSITEPPVRVTLFQGLPKSDKMDFIIQKCVELGIVNIVPVLTERTVVKLEDSKSEQKKVERWNRIAGEAAKQSNRGCMPGVEHPVSFKDSVSRAKDFDLAIIPYEQEQNGKLKEILKKADGIKDICMYIGPEGGFSEREIRMAKENKVIPVTLGPRILRTETAGIAVLSILMYELGDVS